MVFIGRLLGCTTFEPVVEYIGFKKMLVGIGCLQIIAVVSKSSHFTCLDEVDQASRASCQVSLHMITIPRAGLTGR